MLANDTDAENNTLNAAITDAPDSGSYTFNSDGSFTYTPLDGFSGTDSFTYTASDSELSSQPATVAISVETTPEPEPTPEPDTEIPPLGSQPEPTPKPVPEATPEPTPEPSESENIEIVNITFDTNQADAVSNLIFDTTPTGENTEIVARLTDDVLDFGTDAEFDNLIGLYEVVDANGGIDTNGDGVADILPGQEGYARAAIENRVDNFELRAGSSGDESKNTSVEEFGDIILNGGRLYAPFVIANGGELGFSGFIEKEAQESNTFNNAAEFIDDIVAYFGFTTANPDGVAHLEARGNNTFGFEDLPGNLGVSDNDFNDAVFQFNFSV